MVSVLTGFTCLDNQCIPANWECDTWSDCPGDDTSDEDNCEGKYKTHHIYK
jgi:hypothetical protein